MWLWIDLQRLEPVCKRVLDSRSVLCGRSDQSAWPLPGVQPEPVHKRLELQTLHPRMPRLGRSVRRGGVLHRLCCELPAGRLPPPRKRRQPLLRSVHMQWYFTQLSNPLHFKQPVLQWQQVPRRNLYLHGDVAAYFNTRMSLD